VKATFSVSFFSPSKEETIRVENQQEYWLMCRAQGLIYFLWHLWTPAVRLQQLNHSQSIAPSFGEPKCQSHGDEEMRVLLSPAQEKNWAGKLTILVSAAVTIWIWEALFWGGIHILCQILQPMSDKRVLGLVMDLNWNTWGIHLGWSKETLNFHTHLEINSFHLLHH
jgi:hypothetical protein